MSDWKFDLDDVGGDEDGGGTDATDAEDETRVVPPLEPGDPSLEGALFVVLGVAFAIWVVSMLV